MGKRRRKKQSRKGDAPKPTKKLTDAVGERIIEWAEEAAEAYGLDLWDVVARPNWVIQVFVDIPGAADPGAGVTVDHCVDVSRYMEGYLDVDEDVWEGYTLEVSSPGVERKLVTPRHYELSIGRTVRIVVHQPIEKRNVFEGRLVSFDDGSAVVECGPDDQVSIQWDNIAKARLTYDFSE